MKVFYAAILVLVLVSCAPQTQVTTPIQALDKGENFLVNADLNMIAFPRSLIYVSESAGQRTHLVFATPILIDTVYNFFDTQLTGKGWQRQNVRFVERLNTYEGSYTQQGKRLELSLKLEQDHYTLESK
jgi:hypothetical protein